MEIRRCDRCQADIDPKQLEKIDYYGNNDQGKAMKIDIPTILTSDQKEQAQQAEGLDDRDEFGNTISHSEIDLCYDCGVEFANVIKTWLANPSEIGVP